MTEPTPPEIRVRDPLSEVTRKERRLLLGVSIIGIVLAKAGLMPQKISSLGVEFTPINQKFLLNLCAIIVAYFLIAFIIYAATDFIAWRLAWRDVWKGSLRKRKYIEKDNVEAKYITEQERKIEELVEARFKGNRIIFAIYGPTMIIRALFEYLLPIIVGLYTILSLMIFKLP
jgi:hypothetical protein